MNLDFEVKGQTGLMNILTTQYIQNPLLCWHNMRESSQFGVQIFVVKLCLTTGISMTKSFISNICGRDSA
jgi:hypothetical protein